MLNITMSRMPKSNAFCTTLVAKDRVTGHNPIAPLHMLDNYYKKLLQPSELDEIQEISDRNDRT